MAFDLTNAITMTRALNSLIAGADNATIAETLELHAVPRIRLYLLSATKQDGSFVFYEGLDDLADSGKASAAELLVDLVFDEPIISEGLRRVAAALAASWLINSRVGIIEAEQKIAYSLEKMAMADLDRITKSPILASAVNSARDKSNAALGVPVTLTVMLGPKDDQLTIEDVIADPDNKQRVIESYDGAQLPYPTATQAGRVTVNLNGVTFQVSIAEGDTPIDAIRKIVGAYQAIPAAAAPNAALGASELPVQMGAANLPYTNFDGKEVIERFTFKTEGGKLIILPKNYDLVLDVAAMTVYLEHQDELDPTRWKPGIIGFIYGLSESATKLTKNGPHTVAVDLKTGLSTRVSGPTTDPKTGKVDVASDTFIFKIDATTTTVPDTLVYQVNEQPERTVDIPAGSNGTNICELIAQDLATQVGTQRLIGAVRPVTKLMPYGSSETNTLDAGGNVVDAPALELIAIPLETVIAKVVMTISKVPEGVTFGVAPINAVSLPRFDAATKSAIVSCTLGQLRRTITGGGQVGTAPADVPHDIFLVKHIPTTGLKTILDGFKNQRGF